MATRTRKTAKKPAAKKAAAKKPAAKKAPAKKPAGTKAPAKRAATKRPPTKKPGPGPKKVDPVPDDFPTISAHLTVSDMKKAIAFYRKVFGFSLMGSPMKMGKEIIHAVLTLGNSAFMLGAPSPDGTHLSPAAQGIAKQAFGLFVYVPDVDAHWRRVKRQKDLAPPRAPETMFWGDRCYDVIDRDGHRWTFASRVAVQSPAEMSANLKALMAQAPAPKP